MAKTSPTQRSLKYLRDDGWTVAIVEHWNQFAKRRQDLYGFADLIAIRAGDPITLIQTTTQSNAATRVNKIVTCDAARVWLLCGGAIHVHGWRKPAKSRSWDVHVRPISMDDIVPF